MNLPLYIQNLIFGLGVLNTVIGIIVGIKTLKPSHEEKKLQIKDFKNSLIFILIGLVLILFVILLKPECKQPEIIIESLKKNELVNDKIEIYGKAPCVSPDKRIAILVHWVKQEDVLERWFIHSECAALEGDNNWIISGIELGTQSMKGKEFEIFAYAVSDSISKIIYQITTNPTYHGSAQKPTDIISGVSDYKTVKRKF